MRVPPRSAAVLLAALVALLAGAAPDAGPATAEVVAVIDGDTLEVRLDGRNERVRLIGVDAPEVGRGRRAAELFGREAREYVVRRAAGRRVRLEIDPRGDTRDEYGRLLRLVWLPDGKLLNAELIAEGYAHAYTRFPFSRSEEFRALERAARDAGRGLWGPDRVPVLTPGEAASHVGALATVCGPVASAKWATGVRGRPTFLNLERPYPDQSFAVVIWEQDRPAFGRPEQRWLGRRICVTGEIRSHRGRPEIVARDPSQIRPD